MRIFLFSFFWLCTLCACEAKEAQSFEEFQSDYFNARQDEEREDACTDWYDDCVAQGYSVEDCGARLEYCEDGEWNTGDNREEDGAQEESECDGVSTQVYEECLEAGGTQENCRGQAAQAYEDCVRED